MPATIARKWKTNATGHEIREEYIPLLGDVMRDRHTSDFAQGGAELRQLGAGVVAVGYLAAVISDVGNAMG